MALSTGAKLGPYEILSPLGSGGMGEVYRARDTRLDRTVAIKVLNSQLVASSELRARFEREARIVSQLQHPHICVLHDVGHDDNIDFLVMEFLEGESLADRLNRGPLPQAELLKIAIQIADGLAKAHRAGVVHRDLKPGNVMLTKLGRQAARFRSGEAGGGDCGQWRPREWFSFRAGGCVDSDQSRGDTGDTALRGRHGNRHGPVYVARADSGHRRRCSL